MKKDKKELIEMLMSAYKKKHLQKLNELLDLGANPSIKVNLRQLLLMQ